MSKRNNFRGMGGAYVIDPKTGRRHPRASREAQKILAGGDEKTTPAQSSNKEKRS